MTRPSQYNAGFTIVELLIVIVVIGILAAISIVAYNGVTNNANVASAQSDLENVSKSFETYKIQNNDMYPATASALKASAGNTLTYVPNPTNTGYCASITNQATTLFITNTNTTQQSGTCTITNLIPNPSFTTAFSPWAVNNGGGGTTTSGRVVNGGVDGGAFYRIAWTSAQTSGSAYVTMGDAGTNAAARLPLTPGSSYVMTAYVRASWPEKVRLSTTPYDSGGAALATTNSTYITLTPNIWTRLSLSFTSPSNEVSQVVRMNQYTTPYAANGDTFDFDEVMLTAGTANYIYADGNTPGWTWSGVADNSTSSGSPQ